MNEIALFVVIILGCGALLLMLTLSGLARLSRQFRQPYPNAHPPAPAAVVAAATPSPVFLRRTPLLRVVHRGGDRNARR